MFKDTRSSDILNMMATLPQEALAMRRANSSTSKLKKPIKAHTSATLLKLERNKMVVNMYKSGHTIDDTSGNEADSKVEAPRSAS